MPSGIAFAIALACAAAMGFAIQRGATCTVIAVAEVVNQRRFRRLGSMVEASLWVLGGLLAARSLNLAYDPPAGYTIGVPTLAGAALLGLGAYVNRACVFGAIARLGSGEWAYVATPIGFYVGCVVLARLPLAPAVAHDAPAWLASPWLAAAIAILLLVRVVRVVPERSARSWSPHAATMVIGITFLLLFLAAGAWTYTDALAEAARGMTHSVAVRLLLFVGLLAGAVLGGWTAGRLRSTRVTATQVLRCFVGGALMAFGTLLIPGGNDGLILLAMPLLWPYAWLAFAVMCGVIGAALRIEQALGPEAVTKTS
jgi:toxin CptA